MEKAGKGHSCEPVCVKSGFSVQEQKSFWLLGKFLRPEPLK